MNLKNYSLAVAALLFFINGACVAQSALPQLPDTPAANQAKGWLEVFNAGDVEKRRAFTAVSMLMDFKRRPLMEPDASAMAVARRG